MGHHIFYNEQTEKHSFFSVKEKAWHGLGQIVEDYPTSAGAICCAGLDYFVEKRPLFTNIIGNDPDNGVSFPKISVPNYYATVRNDNNSVLGGHSGTLDQVIPCHMEQHLVFIALKIAIINQ